MAEQLRLYSYWRSSAAYRVRIGLNLKGLAFETLPVHLVRDGGQQHAAEYVAKNPQHMVPTLQHGERVIRQSLAILEYLDEAWPSPRLLPMTARDRARVRALAQMVACDIHPLNNLRVLKYLVHGVHASEESKTAWYHHWVRGGLEAFERQLALLAEERAREGMAPSRYCWGDAPTLADCCLVPQLFNAQRFQVRLDNLPLTMGVHAACMQLPAFQQAQPSACPDSEA